MQDALWALREEGRGSYVLNRNLVATVNVNYVLLQLFGGWGPLAIVSKSACRRLETPLSPQPTVNVVAIRSNVGGQKQGQKSVSGLWPSRVRLPAGKRRLRQGEVKPEAKLVVVRRADVATRVANPGEVAKVERAKGRREAAVLEGWGGGVWVLLRLTILGVVFLGGFHPYFFEVQVQR